MLSKGRDDIKKLISTDEKHLTDYEAKLAQVKTEIEKNQNLLRTLKTENEDYKREPTGVELSNMLELKKIDLEQLRHDKIAAPKEFAEAEREEMQRREDARKSKDTLKLLTRLNANSPQRDGQNGLGMLSGIPWRS